MPKIALFFDKMESRGLFKEKGILGQEQVDFSVGNLIK
jgi:hypothetical protein